MFSLSKSFENFLKKRKSNGNRPRVRKVFGEINEYFLSMKPEILSGQALLPPRQPSTHGQLHLHVIKDICD
jgi:hypothetical protein